MGPILALHYKFNLPTGLQTEPLSTGQKTHRLMREFWKLFKTHKVEIKQSMFHSKFEWIILVISILLYIVRRHSIIYLLVCLQSQARSCSLSYDTRKRKPNCLLSRFLWWWQLACHLYSRVGHYQDKLPQPLHDTTLPRAPRQRKDQYANRKEQRNPSHSRRQQPT